jgi:guanylate kinase
MSSESPHGSRGILIVVSSPSGGGKGTLIKQVLQSVEGVGYSVSFTTRAPRAGEVEGRDYHFVTTERFEEMSRTGELLEWAMVHGNLYGTAYSEIERELVQGHDVIVEVDVQGASNVRSKIPEAVAVFILPPSYEVLCERLKGRGSETSRDLDVRLRNAKREVELYKEFDYIILNDDARVASDQLAAIILAERARRERQDTLARQIISTFPIKAISN